MTIRYDIRPIADHVRHVSRVVCTEGKGSIADFFQSRPIDETLARHGALLFRDFEVADDDSFSRLVDTLSTEKLRYRERSTQRKKAADNVYTSTEYPADKTIANHSENAFQNIVPGKILFYVRHIDCRGGETPFADNRRILELLGDDVVESFRRRGIRYLRNFDGGFDLSWQEAFQVDDPALVEAYCHDNEIEFEWLSPTHLRTSQLRNATRVHPVTNEEVWFNQLHLFHITNLERPVRQALLSSVGRALLPRHAVYGDGEEIPDEIVDCIRRAYLDAEFVFPWQTGDVLIADNVLVSHGRKPFEGERAVRVALIDPITYPAFEEATRDIA
ncbi:TauD/TfdA family dioxygenase [Burkholderia sp. LMG 21824]|uniref:TauD/TfdA family dioxygenase n=1 Tax=Burkholderia sp. LMG 21824 TaxID=3158172 RepID=UPI003C2F16BB